MESGFTKGNMDPFVTCPYNRVHRVLRSRIQGHIVRCKSKQEDFFVCPYNATHRLPQAKMKEHTLTCPSRELLFPTKAITHLTAPKPILQREYLPETDPNHEIWDD